MSSPALVARPRRVLLRVMTYNLLVGGRGRWPAITQLVAQARPDLLALQEADDLPAVQRLADELGYQCVPGSANMPRHQAVLTRWSVQRRINHRERAIFLRNSLELEVATPAGAAVPAIRLHTVHLPAAFQRRGRGEPDRLRELAAVLRHAGRDPDTPHLICGDFNAVAPGDPVAATAFFGRLGQLHRTGELDLAGAVRSPPGLLQRLYRGDGGGQGPVGDETDPEWPGGEPLPPELRPGLPRLPWALPALLEALPRGPVTDAVLGSFLPRAAVQSLLDRGYADCRPRTRSGAPAFTCPTYGPAVRIDYIFASPWLAGRRRRAAVVGLEGRHARLARQASDHFPVLAEFDLTAHARAAG